MDNNIIISAWLNVPKAVEKLKKIALKGTNFIQFAPERGEISAFNGPQLQFLPVEFEAVERGEMYVNSLCAVGTCSPKDIKAIAGRRVHMVVKAGKRTKTTWQNRRPVEVMEYCNVTVFYDNNGKILCSHITRSGYVILPAEKAYNAAELTTCASIAVDKKAAKTLAGLLKICVEDNGKGYNNNFSAVSLEWANGESVCVVRSYMVGANEQNNYFRIVEQRVKLSAPAVGSGCIYVQSKLLIDLLANDKTIYIINYNKLASKGKNGVQIVMGCNKAISSSSIDAPKAWIKRAAEVQSEIKAQESAPNIESTTAKNPAPVEVAPAVGENQVNAPKVKQTNMAPQNEYNITTAVDNSTKKPPQILRGRRIPRPRGSAPARVVESTENEIPP